MFAQPAVLVVADFNLLPHQFTPVLKLVEFKSRLLLFTWLCNFWLRRLPERVNVEVGHDLVLAVILLDKLFDFLPDARNCSELKN